MSGATSRSIEQLREDVLGIWQAGVDAVDSSQLIADSIQKEGDWLHIADDTVDLRAIRKIVVVGAGKAGAGMATGLENVLGSTLMHEKQLEGWVNVPANCVATLKRIHLHAARPAEVNAPTEDGVRGTQRILELVQGLQPDDLCICLISGGGSALLPAPKPPVTLADKQAITHQLSGAGANIEELNIVRKQLSQIKGGGLARACRNGQLVNLIISDVIGDPLDIIASGPTVPNSTGPDDALEVLERFQIDSSKVSPRIFECLRSPQGDDSVDWSRIRNYVIGNNAVAVDAAGIEAEKRGYSHAMTAARSMEGIAEDVGHHFAHMTQVMQNQSGPDCLITGGEPVVQLTANPGRGGRNQQLVLQALVDLMKNGGEGDFALLSGGTDGEDGPTDAAGAWIDSTTPQAVAAAGLDPQRHLLGNDAYPLFERLGTLIRSGPTHTNVCDLRVCVVSRIEGERS